YNLSSLNSPVNGSATVTLAGLRMADLGGGSDYTVDGGASASLAGSLDNGSLTQTAILTPTAGTSIVNNTLALRATLAGGSLTVSSTTRVSDDQLTASRVSYSNFAFTVAGTPYLAQGSLVLAYAGTSGALTSGTGEITLFSNGTQIGRLFFGSGGLQIEVNGRVQPFAAPGAGAWR
ncbi:hypothetical protein DBR42_24820, partial [Pelomonas sp. HMWF004]